LYAAFAFTKDFQGGRGCSIKVKACHESQPE